MGSNNMCNSMLSVCCAREGETGALKLQLIAIYSKSFPKTGGKSESVCSIKNVKSLAAVFPDKTKNSSFAHYRTLAK